MSERADYESEVQRPMDIIDERIQYLKDYTPRDQAHADSLQNRWTELEIVKHRIEEARN